MKNVLYNGENSIIYVENDNEKAIARKILKSDFPTPNQILNFNNELEYTKELDHPGVRNTFKALKEDNKHTLILEYVEGETLTASFVETKRTLQEKLKLFINICDALAHVHDHGIVHKDINGNNILWKEKENQPVIIDFGISTKLDLKLHNLGNPDRLQGTLNFMPPEQTGRVDRKVDHRSDLYSLGVLMYQILTGKLPFQSQDSLELVHFQIAKLPQSLTKHDSDLPEVINEIVLTLLEKNAENRYQSALGLKNDLEQCLIKLEDEKEIDNFKIRERDYLPTFEIPQKLYGREKEISTLLESFDRVSNGASEMVMVAGYSGIGKSSLISELYKPITERRAYFVSGKFDQYQHNVPYYALASAFSEFVNLLLSESPESLKIWKEKINEALGDNGQVMVDFIPELEKVIGSQPEVIQLEPKEAQNRFNLVLQSFLKAICRTEHPFVLFIDDLQWADISSLLLLKQMAGEMESNHFLFIGAYRDNEIGAGHSLPKIIDEIGESGTKISSIKLKALLKKDVKQLVSDALQISGSEAKKLSDLVYTKTGGNAFFTIEFLKSLYQNKIFEFSVIDQEWNIDYEAIDKMAMSNNVVELMAAKIDLLDDDCKHALKLASCIGGVFSLNLLADIYGSSIEKTKDDIWPALVEGLIVPVGLDFQFVGIEEVVGLNVEFQFLHDRVQQAAYSGITGKEKKQTHYTIGKHLLKDYEENEELLFEVTNQLNEAVSLITSEEEKLKLARMNLLSAKRARGASAYQNGLEYINRSTSLINEEIWETDYDFAKELYTVEVDLEFLNGNVSSSLELIQPIIDKVKTTLEKVALVSMKMRNLSLVNRNEESIETGIEGLKMLDFDMPAEGHEALIPEQMQKAAGYLATNGFDSVLKLPHLKDPVLLETMRVLDNFSEPTYVSGKVNHWILHVLYKVNLTIEHGQSAEGAYAFVELGLIFFILNNFDFAYPSAELSVEMVKPFEEESPKHLSRIGHLFTNYNTPWVKPISETISLNAKYFKVSVDTGEMIFAGYTSWSPQLNRYFWGNNTALEMLTKLEDEIAFNQKIKHILAYHSSLGLQLILKHLSGQSKKESTFDTKGLLEAPFLKTCLEAGDYYSLTVYKVLKAQVLFIEGERKQAAALCEDVQAFAAVIAGLAPGDSTFRFIQALSLIALEKESKERQNEKREIIEAHIGQMEIWAKHNPSSFQHKFLLMKAEYAGLNNDIPKAIDHYKRAIDSANDHSFQREAAMANQLAGEFWLKQNNPVYARPHLMEAKYLYSILGFSRIESILVKKYPTLVKTKRRGGFNYGTINSLDSTISGDSITTSADNLDFLSIIKSSQILSGEIMLDKLLEKMLNIVIENAAGQRASLILQNEGEWLVEAQYDVEENDMNVLQGVKLDDIQNLPKNVINYVIRTGNEVLSTDKATNRNFSRDEYLKKEKPASFFCIPLVYQGMNNGILYVEHKLSEHVFTPERMTVIRFLSSQMAVSLDNASLYDNLSHLNRVYQRFVPHEFIKALGHDSIMDISLGDQIHQDMTVMFCDIRSYSALAEGMTPEDNFNFINAYLRRVGPIIRKNGGFINHYFGDGFIALFKDSPTDGVKAALDIFSEIDEYNKERVNEQREPIGIGVGIHTGDVMMGIIGDKERNDANVISDSVNTASRLEGLTKIFGSKIIVSSSTFKSVQEDISLRSRFLGMVRLKGKEEVLNVHEILEPELNEDENKLEVLKDYEEALDRYYAKQFPMAAQGFMKVLNVIPEDYAAKMYFNNCADIIKNGLPEDWNGVENMTEK